MDNRHEWTTPIGREQMRQFVGQDRMHRDERLNKRRANCKVCGTRVPKGTGVRWHRRHEYHFITFYLCPKCDEQAQATQVKVEERVSRD